MCYSVFVRERLTLETLTNNKQKGMVIIMNKTMYFNIKNDLDKMTGEDFGYANVVFANVVAIGKRKLTADAIRKVLLSNVEDEFITYEQAVNARKLYENYFGVVA